jgi:protein-disulfide isomerase
MFGVRAAIVIIAAAFALTGCTSTVSGTPVPVTDATYSGPRIPVAAVPNGNYPVTFDQSTATVLVGAGTAKFTLDIYADLLCPICGTFERNNGTGIDKALAAGTIAVRYHLLNLLDQQSTPAGYSTLAANAALAVAATAPKAFPSYLNSLFARQPAEYGAGYSAEELIDLGRQLGVGGSQFETLVRKRQYAARISANLTAAENDPALIQPSIGQFGTPTVLVNGQLVDWTQPDWLATATG